MTKQQINRAIKHLGIEVEAKRGDGYSYFLSLTTRDQIGESQMVCYLYHRTLDQWVKAAEEAVKSGIINGMLP